MPFQVEQYSKVTLVSFLERSCLQDAAAVELDDHVLYLNTYLTELNAKTILLEPEYIDKDYLDDFSSYYVKCFFDYERKCTRVHFFDFVFSKKDFLESFDADDSSFCERLQQGYLGFTVVKNLPVTFVGRTCLKTYSDLNGRTFPCLRKYKAHLYGYNLTVDSLAFQEQDQVAAACATSCLWSLFHATGKLFQHPIPTPIEITRAATKQMPAQKRVTPNDSLNIEQMAEAIRSFGLEPHFVNVLRQDYLLKSTIYSYARAGIPSALVIYFVDTSVQPNQVDSIQHAIAVTGYRMGDGAPVPEGVTGFLSKASSIDKIYCHDDQVGPFARMESGKKVTVVTGDKPVEYSALSTSWKGRDGLIGSKLAVANIVLIPLYNKIRIPLSSVERIILDFDALVEQFRNAKLVSLPKRIVWDIFLQGQNELKSDIMDDDQIDVDEKRILLTSSFPRFVWRARAYCDKEPVIEVLIDATDIEQRGGFLGTVKIDKMFCSNLNTIFVDPKIKAQLSTSGASSIFQSLSDC